MRRGDAHSAGRDINQDRQPGATYLGSGRCRFELWAPDVARLEIHILSPQERLILLDRDGRGYHRAVVEGVRPGCRYLYRLEGDREHPDPASRFQPEGVHGASEVVDIRYRWLDRAWTGLSLADYVIYELHIGTYTAEGTCEALISHLDELKELGITALELMPLAQFPGSRNWGYDGVFPFAVQNSYGGPAGLQRLVQACHQRGLAVVLDVVYNHLGPEGNYLWGLGPYFSHRHHTPWGPGLNFDGPGSDEVRHFFIQNALYWLTTFHLDALRLDAVHAIVDQSARTFLEQLAVAVQRQARLLGRRVHLFAESIRNDPREVLPAQQGGVGLDAVWNDDFHHALHALLTGERAGYYQDFGRVTQLARAFRSGFVFTGQYSAYRQRRHGRPARGMAPRQFVVFAQNHDQVGNRPGGDRLSRQVSLEQLKLAAAVVLLAPFVPLLFMGEEYAESAPFHYFVSHGEEQLVEAVRAGRRAEFARCSWPGEPADPQGAATFSASRLTHDRRCEEVSQAMREFYRSLLQLRKTLPALARPAWKRQEVRSYEREMVLTVRRWNGQDQALAVFHFGATPVTICLPVPAARWQKLLDSAEACWQGAGSRIPADVVSRGEVELGLAPYSALLFSLDVIPACA